MQREKVISEDSISKVIARWDGSRFALVQIDKTSFINPVKTVIILNPREVFSLVKFAGSLGVEE